jgi:hypothetical protein
LLLAGCSIAFGRKVWKNDLNHNECPPTIIVSSIIHTSVKIIFEHSSIENIIKLPSRLKAQSAKDLNRLIP